MTKIMTSAQRTAMFARKNAASKAAKAGAPVAVLSVAEAVVNDAVRRARTPIDVEMTVEAFEERSGAKAGNFGYAKVTYLSRKGQPKTGATAMAFGDVYAAIKDSLVPGATLKVKAFFNFKKNVGYSISIAGLAA